MDRTMRTSQVLIWAGFVSAAAWSVIAADDRQGSGGVSFFESKIRPVLVKNCYECHSATEGTEEGGLQVDTREAIREGGGRGPAVVPGKLEASLLLTALSHGDADLKMPPKQPKLSDAIIADFAKWIEMGAPDPRNGKESAAADGWNNAEKARSHWAYQRPQSPPVPSVGQQQWPKRPVDDFILSKLTEHNLAPAPDAAPHVLLRRLHFDLVGLPPAPDAINRFLSAVDRDGFDEAWAIEVDELLASPQFGERWGRHWLDVARFGESSGKEANIAFPYAWRYRDYVIDCFNADVPYDRFLTEQIAGDKLPYDDDAERARLLIATGFLAMGAKNLDEGNDRQFTADLIDEQIDTVSRAVLGNSVACARCHDHKFDPFSMRDYYALAGVFASTNTFFGTSVSPSNRQGGDPLQLPELTNQVVLHQAIPKKRVDQLKADLAELKAEKAEMDKARAALFSGQKPEKEFTLRDVLSNFWRTGSVEGQLEKVDDDGRPLPLAMGVLDREHGVDAPLLARGDVSRPGETVPRGFPQALAVDGSTVIPTQQSGRLELAQWLTHPEHPLTSRVMVNRIWQHVFGAGLVSTVDNFGTTGEAPSHPELLDHLAIQFVENGWSVKRMVRELVLSRTYRQSSTYDAAAFDKDPDNRLLWRASKRRLEAEAIRDAMLAVSGELDLKRPDGS
ncbi:MAG: PSD1 and planctomycete cytochrome C domain-containing protein, partial [Planctomycetaceae bacterium]